jgi:cysteinyl-tRNA synthetase
MITINGRKMGKSYNNVIKLTELFSGTHELLAKAYHPMTVRFFILQTHYSSTLDFSNEALQAAEKGLRRMWDAYEGLKRLDLALVGAGSEKGQDEALEAKIQQLLAELPVFMNDDFSTAKVLANIFELVPIINSIKDGLTPKGAVSITALQHLATTLQLWLEDILGLRSVTEVDNTKLQQVMELLIDIRKEAKGKKDFATSDQIRDRLAAIGIQLKDEKGGGMSWTIE